MGDDEVKAKLRALEAAFMHQTMLLNVLFRNHAATLAEFLGDDISNLPPHERASHYGQALLDIRYQLQALGEIDQGAPEPGDAP
ncbi:hypothetical protein [Rhodospirillum sp. A1_3_36]|uniref:hypothetical protein n=1 Tax=Rhodospirillum sp. A1_3_36 TaxID=3391666 RepID=UPI0039A4F53D